MLYYAEGGRSYSGEMKPPKTGLLQASLAAERRHLKIVPMAVSYDLVLEDRILSQQAAKKKARPFSAELAEMVRDAVGYETRAFVTFGEAIPLSDYDPESRRDLVTLAHRIQHEIGLLYKVLPTALVAATVKPMMTRAELATRIDDLIAAMQARHPINLGVKHGRQAVAEAWRNITAVGARQDVTLADGSQVTLNTRTRARANSRNCGWASSHCQRSGCCCAVTRRQPPVTRSVRPLPTS